MSKSHRTHVMEPGDIVDGGVGLQVTGKGDGAALPHCGRLRPCTMHTHRGHRHDCWHTNTNTHTYGSGHEQKEFIT